MIGSVWFWMMDTKLIPLGDLLDFDCQSDI